jgi:16S rRNA processing protein RimM
LSTASVPVDALSALPIDAIEVGRVLGAWGVKGGLKIKPFAADPQALFSTKRWYLQPPESDTPGPRLATATTQHVLPALLRVVSAKEHGDGVVATVHDVTDRDMAEALRGARIFVSRASFPTPDANEFYWVDLIGMAVFNQTAEAVGRVVDLIETGPHCVIRVQPADASAEEVLIPFVDAYVSEVDQAARTIHVEWDSSY